MIHNATIICVHDLSPHGKGNSCLMKLLGGLPTKKIWRYNNSPPYVVARWPPQQIPPLKLPGKHGQVAQCPKYSENLRTTSCRGSCKLYNCLVGSPWTQMHLHIDNLQVLTSTLWENPSLLSRLSFFFVC